MAHETRTSSLLQDFDRRLVNSLATYHGKIPCNMYFEEYDESGGVAGVRPGVLYGKFAEVDCSLALDGYCDNRCTGHVLIWWLRADSSSYGAIWRNDLKSIMVFERTEIGLKTLLAYQWRAIYNPEDPQKVEALCYWLFAPDLEGDAPTITPAQAMAQFYGREDWKNAWILPDEANPLDVRRGNIQFVLTIEVDPEEVHSRIALHKIKNCKYWRASINRKCYTRPWHPLERESPAYKELYDIVEDFLSTKVYM
jgi:hypothetical protein